MTDTQRADGRAGAPRVVVGVDGSAQSVSALRCAAEEAAWRRATLVVVNAWQRPEGTSYPGYAVVTMEPAAAFEERAHQLIAAALADAFGPGGPPVPFSIRILESAAAAALIKAAEGAALLVVGSRGRGGLRSMLGSTSQRCVLHAPCPVLVVRPAGAYHGVHEAAGVARRERSEPPMRAPLF